MVSYWFIIDNQGGHRRYREYQSKLEVITCSRSKTQVSQGADLSKFIAGGPAKPLLQAGNRHYLLPKYWYRKTKIQTSISLYDSSFSPEHVLTRSIYKTLRTWRHWIESSYSIGRSLAANSFYLLTRLPLFGGNGYRKFVCVTRWFSNKKQDKA